MRKLHALGLALVAALMLAIGLAPHVTHAVTLPSRPDTDYYDAINLLDDTTRQLVEDKNEYYQSTKQKPQVVLAAIKSTGGRDIDSYAPDLFSKWGIGQKGKDNGILILFARNDGSNNARIEVGYGAEDYMTDAIAGRILNDNLDDLKSSDDAKVNTALRNIFSAVATMVDKHYKFKSDSNTISTAKYNEYRGRGQSHGSGLIGSIIKIVIALMVVLAIIGGIGGGRGGRGGSSGNGWFWFILGNLLSSSVRGGYRSGDWRDDDDDDHFGGFGGFGGGGDSGFGGGGGGFGGGSSGGGGASV